MVKIQFRFHIFVINKVMFLDNLLSQLIIEVFCAIVIKVGEKTCAEHCCDGD